MLDNDKDWDDRDWDRLIDQLERGDCTPFVGAGACRPTLPTGGELGRQWAKRLDYPFADHDDLARVMQYAVIDSRDPVSLKHSLVRELRALGRPDFRRPTEPHAMLAQFPLLVYLTTNYDDFMATALREEGKVPRIGHCPWYRMELGGRRRPAARESEPTADNPIVYHLHGLYDDPRTLVLAEDDYLEFLVNLAIDEANGYGRMVPKDILAAVTLKPLLFVGYQLNDWTFRVLFHGLLRTTARTQLRRHVSIQLRPPVSGDRSAIRRAERYLEAYFSRWNISIFWGTSDAFFGSLRSRLEQRRGTS